MKIGDRLGQYTIVEHIGRGGMADVWSAHDERLQRTVAIKTITPNLIDERTRSQFEHEARIIAALEHSNILPIYDFGEFERQLYIVMRYVPGGSLLDWIIDRGWLPNDEVVRIGDAVSQALDRAHRDKIVHRDLKPANVLLDRFGTPYLADFGLAAVIGGMEEEGASSGTLMYMPPEQLYGKPVDHRADIYAFAILIFQMITGEFPMEGQALCLEQSQHGAELNDPRRYRPDLPEHIVTVLRVATAVDVSARYDSVRVLMDEVRAALMGHTVFVGAVTPPDYGPPQEPLPYRAETALGGGGEDLIVTLRGDSDVGTETDLAGHRNLVVDSGLGVESDLAARESAAPGPLGADSDLLETAAIDSAELARRFLAGLTGAPSPARPVEPPHAAEEEAGEPSPLDEARQVYERMVRQWLRGQGRFLTGATHFANVHAFYSKPEAHGLELSETGRDVLLRGALEHQYALEHWLAQVPDAARRRVIFVHALRSDLAAARALAVQLLRAVPDGDGVSVASTVARLLHAETSVEVRRAIVELLGARGTHPAAWRDVAFNQDTDLLLAEQALRTDAPDVAELAARAIGRLSSRTAALHIAAQEAAQPAEVRAALAWMRDEADSLPAELPLRQRARAFGRLTAHYTGRRIGRLGLRFFTSLLGTGIGLAIYVYFAINTDQRTLLRLDLLFTTIANGQTFGLVAGLGLALAAALPLRLAGSEADRPDGATLWRWWGRLLAGLLLGGLICTVAYLNFHFVFLRLPDPRFLTALQGGLGLALGAALGSTFRWPLPVRLILTAVLAFLPLYHTCFGTPDPIIYFTDVGGWCSDPASSDIWRLGLPLAILAALGAYGPEVIDWLRGVWHRAR